MWQNDILVLPGDLIAFAWSAPMRDLAAKLELSDVGLKKLLTRCGVASQRLPVRREGIHFPQADGAEAEALPAADCMAEDQSTDLG